MRSVDVFISHANVDKPLIKPIIEALMRDGFAVFVDRPEDEGLAFAADDIAYWRNDRNRLWHLRPCMVDDYDKALLGQIKGARVVLGCLCTPLKPGQDHFGDELLLGASDGKLMLCRLGELSPDEVLAKKGGLVKFSKAQVCDARRIAPLTSLLEGRGLDNDGDWPEPANEAQRQALEQYKFLRKELEDKLGGWKLGSLSARTSEALKTYAKLLRSKVDRLSTNASKALADALREQNVDPLAEALEERRSASFVDLAMNIGPFPILDAFARALHILDEQHAPETDAQWLRRAAHVIAPMMSNQSDTRRLQRALDGGEVKVIDARVGSGTMVEVLMAAAQGKETDFRPRRKRGERALGRRAITPAAEAGPEDGEARDVAALILDLAEMKGVKIDVSRVKSSVKRVLEQEYGELSSYQQVKTRLEHQMKMKEPRYYLLAVKPDAPPALQHLQDVLKQVCDATPGLVAIVIDPTLSDEEDKLLQSLLDTIEIEGGKGKNAKD